jgi:hypothetical protein
MFNIFRQTDEFESKLVKQCPSCHGFIKSSEAKCRHCGNSTQQEPVTHLTLIIRKTIPCTGYPVKWDDGSEGGSNSDLF